MFQEIFHGILTGENQMLVYQNLKKNPLVVWIKLVSITSNGASSKSFWLGKSVLVDKIRKLDWLILLLFWLK